MKVLVHERDEPGSTGFACGVFWFADDDDRRRPESREGGEQIGWELAWTRIKVVSDFLEAFGWLGAMHQEFCIRGHKQQWCRRPTPVGPDLILNLRDEAIEFADAHSIISGELCGGSLGEYCCCDQQEGKQGSHCRVRRTRY